MPKKTSPVIRNIDRDYSDTVVQTGMKAVQLIFSDRRPTCVVVRFVDGKNEQFAQMPTESILVAGQRMIQAAIRILEAIEYHSGLTDPPSPATGLAETSTSTETSTPPKKDVPPKGDV